MVPVNEPLAKLLAELHLCDSSPVAGYILRRSHKRSSLSLDNLLTHVIIPTLMALSSSGTAITVCALAWGTMAAEVVRDQDLAAKSLLRHRDLATTSEF